MQMNMLKAKIHRAAVTECDLDYEGSISIDRLLMDAAGLIPFEQVDIYNVYNGERFTTYVIEAAAGTGTIGLNGAAARKAVEGDEVIICSYCSMTPEEAASFEPKIVLVNDDNSPKASDV